MARFKSSITEAQADRFVREADYGATKFCTSIKKLYLFKLKKKNRASWRYRYTDQAGRRRNYTIGPYPGIKPEQAATRALQFILEEADPLKARKENRRAARKAEKDEQRRTLGRYLDGLYWSRHQSRRKSGKNTVQRIQANWGHLAERDMASLCQEDVRTWQEEKELEGRMAYTTMKREYGALKSLLNRAVEDGVIEVNPLANVKLLDNPNDDRMARQLQKRRAARRLLTDEEIAGLHAGLDAFADRLRAQRRNSRAHGKPHLQDLDTVQFPHYFIPFTYVALYTGMRPGDIYALRWEEVSLDFGKINKVAEKTRHHPEPPEINMDIAAPLLDVLKKWHRQQGRPLTGLVFPSPVTGKRMDKDSHRRAWAQVKRLGGLPDDLVFYALRTPVAGERTQRHRRAGGVGKAGGGRAWLRNRTKRNSTSSLRASPTILTVGVFRCIRSDRSST